MYIMYMYNSEDYEVCINLHTRASLTKEDATPPLSNLPFLPHSLISHITFLLGK